MRQSGLVAGWFLILLSATLGCKSLTMLVETAKHVDVQSYELLCEAVFGQIGWIGCNIMMFLMSFGPMLSYMILVKDTLGTVLAVDSDTALVVSSVLIMLPLCLQRDVADLAKTSRVSVLFDIGLVYIIAKYSPIAETAEAAGGFAPIISNSIFRPRTTFIGLGILSFAFSCQHSSLIIAGSLENPTRERWTRVSRASLGFCATLGIIMGTCGYLGFTEHVDGNILNNFAIPSVDDTSDTAKAANVARALLCCTMFCVFPLEHFVARHVIMTNLFSGRQAREGDDHAVLDRWDRRAAITVVLFSISLLSALRYDDVGLVLAWTGTVAATTLSYIVPGMLYLGVNGQDYLEFVQDRWGFVSLLEGGDISWYQSLLWYSSLMPIWCGIASMGSRGVAEHEAKKALMSPTEFRLGKIIHKRKMYDAVPTTTSPSTNESQLDFALNDAIGLEEGAEEDPLDDEKSATDFIVAISFILFGVLAFVAGVFSICTES